LTELLPEPSVWIFIEELDVEFWLVWLVLLLVLLILTLVELEPVWILVSPDWPLIVLPPVFWLISIWLLTELADTNVTGNIKKGRYSRVNERCFIVVIESLLEGRVKGGT
jgi:hypothetical protein